MAQASNIKRSQSIYYKSYIQINYNEDPDSFAKELDEVGRLRSNSCIRPREDVTGVTDIKRYYSQLHLLQNRFKIESGDKGPFNFSWNDPYSGTLYTLPDFDYELASVLYNLGSLHSTLGAAEKRDTSESMKVACTHFQCAAWAFHTLPDKYPKVYTPDISPDLMAVMSQICLAQAQECILEKSILDHRKSSIISKVGAQVSDYYFAALVKLETSNARHLTSDILLMGGAPPGEETVMESIGHKKNANWIRQIEFKFVYHKAVAYLYAGLNSEEFQKMGERITLFQASSDKLMECAKIATSTAKDSGIWKEALTFSNDVIKGKLENSKKENEFIYHEKVPDLETLTELKGASLVKGIGFEVTDPDVAGADIFCRLVPLEAHEASSLYSEEKAKLLRVIGEEIESKNNEIAVFMSSMSLDEDGVVPKPYEQIALPQELIEVAASLSVKGEDNVIGHLKTAMSRIAAVSAEVETSLKEINEMIKADVEKEGEYARTLDLEDKEQKDMTAERGQITEEITSECEKYEGAHKMASDSNSTLHNAIRLHMDNLKLLTLPLEQLQKEIPSMADLDEDSEANVAEVRRILSKVDEMKLQRLTLEESFRRQVMEDDITKKLVLHKDKQLPEIFEIELQKHDQAKKVLMQNLLAQANIKKALTEVNAKYVDTRRIISELTNSRNEMIGSLVASFYAHEDLLQKATKGLEFYDKLDSNVTKLLHRVEQVVKKHQEQRDAILAKFVPTPSNILTDTGGNQYPYALQNMNAITSVGPEHTSTYAPSNIHSSTCNMDVDLSIATSAMGTETIDSNSPIVSKGSAGGKPTLKDYLKIMKETKNDASAAYAAINYPGKPGDDSLATGAIVQQHTILPTVRPPPVGSESVDEPILHYSASTNATIQQPIPFQESQYTKQFMHSQNPSGKSTLPQNSVNPNISPSNLYGNHSIPSQSGLRQATLPSLDPNTNSQRLGMPVSQPAIYSTVSRTDASAIATVNQTQYQIPSQISLDISRQRMQPMTYYPPTYTSSSNITGYYPPTSQFRPSTPNVPAASSLKANESLGNPIMSTQVPRPLSGPFQSPVTAGFSSIHPNSATVHPTIHTISTSQTYSTESAQQILQSQQMANNCQFPAGSRGNDYVYGLNAHPSLKGDAINAVAYSRSCEKGLVSKSIPSASFPNAPFSIRPNSGSINVPTNNEQILTSCTKMITQIPSPMGQAVSGRPQHMSTMGYPHSFASMPQTNPSPAIVSQPGQQMFHPNQVSINPQVLDFHQTYSQQPHIQDIRSGSQILQPSGTHNYQYVSTPKEHFSVNQNLSIIPKVQSLPESNLQCQWQLNTSKGQSIHNLGNSNSIAQQTYPLQNNCNANVQHKDQGQIVAPFVANLHTISPIKMKPIVPQPGTASGIPNINPNMSYEMKASQQITNQLTANTCTSNQPRPIPIAPSEADRTLLTPVRRSSSFDDMLDNEKDDNDGSSSVVTLQPKVMTPKELAEQKREAEAFSDIIKATNRDPYEDENIQRKLLEDVKLIESNFLPASDGNTQIWLNKKWKLFNTFLTTGSVGTGEMAVGGGALSVARCYPMKNRAPDILPFDSSRVELPTTKDDYINASHIRHLTPHAPNFIATQWPPVNTHYDFWTMVWQEQIEIIVCLLGDPPVQKDVYWPTDKKAPLEIRNSLSGGKSTAPSLDITLQNIKVESQTEQDKSKSLARTERTFTVLNLATNTSRVVIHIQLAISANTSGKVLTKSLSELASVCLAHQRQQRVLTHPILAHCLDGSGRTASFILMVAAISEIDVAVGTNNDYEKNELDHTMSTDMMQDSFKIMPDLVKMAALMAQQRKGILRDQHHFKNSYESMLLHSRSILIRKGVLKPSSTNVVGPKDSFESGHVSGVKETKIDPIQPNEISEKVLDIGNAGIASTHKTTEMKSTSPANFFPAELLTNNLADLNLSDPLCLTASGNPQQKKRITKHDFLNASNSSLSKLGKSSIDGDPLSQLDPLWSMK